ncbi:hypothetical protein [Anthocerotibacter panamensis]|uniref:hypothetical protein n=1 Tax=Anthocerotibacter panamensis TaxID=2857077 RepID=UPI001C40288E|nr:hypothetical protein [Anthocerotibacter panamensis]
MQTRIFRAPGLKADALAERVRQWFVENHYETQIFRTADDKLIVQGFRDDLWRVAIGFAAALTVQIRALDEDKLEVDLGAGAWGDKIIVAGIGLLLFLPLVLTAAWGTWQQYQLDQQIWAAIEGALPADSETLNEPPTPTAPSTMPLPQSWFDESSGEIYALRFFERMESWQRAIADGRIEPTEIQAQAEWVSSLLRGIEPTLSDSAHAKLTAAFREIAVLQGMQSYALLQHLDTVPPP